MKSKVVFNGAYSWESLNDIERDIYEIEWPGLAEFGEDATITVVITVEEQDESL